MEIASAYSPSSASTATTQVPQEIVDLIIHSAQQGPSPCDLRPLCRVSRACIDQCQVQIFSSLTLQFDEEKRGAQEQDPVTVVHRLNEALDSNPYLAKLIRTFKIEVPAQTHWPDVVSEEMARLLPRLDNLKSIEIRGLLWDSRIPKPVKSGLLNCISAMTDEDASLSLTSCFFVSVTTLLIIASHAAHIKSFDLRDTLLLKWDVPANDVLPKTASSALSRISPTSLHINTSLLLLVLMKLGPEMTRAFDVTKVKDLDVHANCLFPLGWLKLPEVEKMRIECFCEQQDDLPKDEKAGHHHPFNLSFTPALKSMQLDLSRIPHHRLLPRYRWMQMSFSLVPAPLLEEVSLILDFESYDPSVLERDELRSIASSLASRTLYPDLQTVSLEVRVAKTDDTMEVKRSLRESFVPLYEQKGIEVNIVDYSPWRRDG